MTYLIDLVREYGFAFLLGGIVTAVGICLAVWLAMIRQDSKVENDFLEQLKRLGFRL